MDEPKVNDGNGLFDRDGLIDTLVLDCNDLTKAIAGGNYVAYCHRIVQMVQKLEQLKEGARKELEDRDAQIAELKRSNDELMRQLLGLPAGGDTGAA